MRRSDSKRLPRGRGAVQDPRSKITLRHVLNMSSGLETIDNGGLEYATGSGMSYWAGASSVDGARNRGLIREPGTSWDYENYDTLLAVYAMKQALGTRVPTSSSRARPCWTASACAIRSSAPTGSATSS